jgi:hypothetical protein
MFWFAVIAFPLGVLFGMGYRRLVTEIVVLIGISVLLVKLMA